jgi:hypothetical protein
MLPCHGSAVTAVADALTVLLLLLLLPLLLLLLLLLLQLSCAQANPSCMMYLQYINEVGQQLQLTPAYA